MLENSVELQYSHWIPYEIHKGPYRHYYTPVYNPPHAEFTEASLAHSWLSDLCVKRGREWAELYKGAS